MAESEHHPGISLIEQRRRRARRVHNSSYIERRNQVLDAALAVFKEKGLEGASINDVAERLGTDRASIYYYYADKEELYLGIVQKAMEEIANASESTAELPQPAIERLQLIVAALVSSYDRYYPLVHLYLREDSRLLQNSADLAAELQKLDMRFQHAVTKVTTEGVEAGDFRPDLDPHLVMLAILGSVNWAHRWFVPRSPSNAQRTSSKEVAKEFVGFLARGLVADNAIEKGR